MQKTPFVGKGFLLQALREGLPGVLCLAGDTGQQGIFFSDGGFCHGDHIRHPAGHGGLVGKSLLTSCHCPGQPGLDFLDIFFVKQGQTLFVQLFPLLFPFPGFPLLRLQVCLLRSHFLIMLPCRQLKFLPGSGQV